MKSSKKTSLTILAIVFIAIYGIGFQPYFDLYLLVFVPDDINGYVSFKILVLYKFLLALSILVTSISTLISKEIKLPFLVLNVIYSISVIVLNALVIFGYNELNSFYYTDFYSEVRIAQQIVWVCIIWMLFKKTGVNQKH
jgi:hypothetical protein